MTKEIMLYDYNQNWCFSIDKIKIILGKERYRFFRALKHQFLKEEKSEYETSIDSELSIKVNNQRFDSKNYKLYLVDLNSNIDDEVKLSSKSMFTEFLESKLKAVDYEDEFIMLNQSIDILNQSTLEDISITFNDVKIIFELPKFSFKTLIKSLTSSQLKNDVFSLDYDLSLEEKLELYLNVIESIALENKTRHHTLVLVVDKLPKSIYNKIEQSLPDNLNIILFAHNFEYDVVYKDIFIIGNGSLDLSNDEDIYNHLVIDKGLAVDLDSVINTLIKMCSPLAETSKLLDLV